MVGYYPFFMGLWTYFTTLSSTHTGIINKGSLPIEPGEKGRWDPTRSRNHVHGTRLKSQTVLSVVQCKLGTRKDFIEQDLLDAYFNHSCSVVLRGTFDVFFGCTS